MSKKTLSAEELGNKLLQTAKEMKATEAARAVLTKGWQSPGNRAKFGTSKDHQAPNRDNMHRPLDMLQRDNHDHRVVTTLVAECKTL